jgi:hypothetical protein
MAQPTNYDRLYNFTDWQTVRPSKPLPATELDAELNAIELAIDQTQANLALIQRDDGKLANQSVVPEALSASTLAMIAQGEYNPRGDWATATAYAIGDLVTYNLATYLCLATHTAAAAFSTDLAFNRWLLIANAALTGEAQVVDLFEGTGAQTVFLLSVTYQNSDSAIVFVGGVAQVPVQDFTIDGSTLTFVVPPAVPAVPGRKNVMVRGADVSAQIALEAATEAANSLRLYLGPASIDPVTDVMGQPLLDGAFYYNNVARLIRTYDASIPGWVNATPSGQFKRLSFAAPADFTPGVTTALALPTDPGPVDNVFVSFAGVNQHVTNFSLAPGSVLTFAQPIPVGVSQIEVSYIEAVFSDPDAIDYGLVTQSADAFRDYGALV